MKSIKILNMFGEKKKLMWILLCSFQILCNLTKKRKKEISFQLVYAKFWAFKVNSKIGEKRLKRMFGKVSGDVQPNKLFFMFFTRKNLRCLAFHSIFPSNLFLGS